MTDSELREKIKQVRSNNRSLNSILTSGAIDELLHLIKQNFPQGEVSTGSLDSRSNKARPRNPSDSSIPDDAEELAEQLLALPKGTNKPLCWDMDVLVGFIHQQRQRWDARAKTAGAIEANEKWLAHIRRVHKLVNISQLEKEIGVLKASLAAAEGKEEV